MLIKNSEVLERIEKAFENKDSLVKVPTVGKIIRQFREQKKYLNFINYLNSILEED